MNKSEKINFYSESHQIEALIEFNEASDPKINEVNEFAIICHPHPMHGGSMNNKVVYSLVKACTEKNIPTLRFNFRGVGESQGSFGNLAGEMVDLASAIEVVQSRFQPKSIRLGGFSFGSYVALKMHCDMEKKDSMVYQKPLIIAPPVGVEGYHFENLKPKEALVVIGKQDQIVDESLVRSWVFSRPGKVDYICFADCEHFFHRKTVLLKNTLIAMLS